MWKIIDCRGKKHFYDNIKSYNRYWKEHQKFCRYTKRRYKDAHTWQQDCVGYAYEIQNNKLVWREIDREPIK